MPSQNPRLNITIEEDDFETVSKILPGVPPTTVAKSLLIQRVRLYEAGWMLDDQALMNGLLRICGDAGFREFAKALGKASPELARDILGTIADLSPAISRAKG